MPEETGFLPHSPGMPEAINADSFDEDVLRSPVPAVVEFWAARCGACRRLSPEMAATDHLLQGQVRFFTLNVDEELPAAIRFGVASVPALLLFENGQEKGRHFGFLDRAALVHFIRYHLGGS
ncbi:MAG: thioredoxin domain-containing protein [Capsulimonadales bacterium]|nr:thioredoxin domain-containing protein [Capsulimonadales bacterium]